MKPWMVVYLAAVMTPVFLLGVWGVVKCVEASTTGESLRVWVSAGRGGMVEPPGFHLSHVTLAPAGSRVWWAMLVSHGLWTVVTPGFAVFLWIRAKRRAGERSSESV